jgi:hypothetical protein
MKCCEYDSSQLATDHDMISHFLPTTESTTAGPTGDKKWSPEGKIDSGATATVISTATATFEQSCDYSTHQASML